MFSSIELLPVVVEGSVLDLSAFLHVESADEADGGRDEEETDDCHAHRQLVGVLIAPAELTVSGSAAGVIRIVHAEIVL